MSEPDRRPDVVVLMTDQERAAPPYEPAELSRWRRDTLAGSRWFDEHAVSFRRHYTGSLACVPSRPTIFTGQYPDLHGVTQTDGLGKMEDDSRMRWLREGEVPTLGHWFRVAGYDTHYDGKWHITHADLHDAGGERIVTNDDDGNVLADGVQRYVDADPLDAFGFSGWIGPEPHGGALADSGFRRDPLIADRVVAWLADRYARRRAGDAAAMRPFLLVASFVNPHDIVLFPAWARRSPIEPSPIDPPNVPPAPTHDEDLATKPAAQIAYRASYPSTYGPAPAVARVYERRAQQYRDLYHRLHAEVDAPLDRVRRAVTDGGSDHAVVVRTSDHGELLGAHGGLHQKWFNLYDEATRVPFSIARMGDGATTGAVVERAPTSHVDIVPTLLAAAGIDEAMAADVLRSEFSEVHPLPGTNLMPVVDDPGRVRSRTSRLPARRATTCPRETPVRPASPVGSDGSTSHRPRCASRSPLTWPRTSRDSSCVCTTTWRPVAPGISGSWSAASTIPPRGPIRTCGTSLRPALPAPSSVQRRSPTSGSCTTSTPIRSRR